MSIPLHFARNLSDFPASRVREDASMTSMPICPNCFHAMVIEWRLNVDGDKISRATCYDCNEVKPITASVAPKDASLDLPDTDEASDTFERAVA